MADNNKRSISIEGSNIKCQLPCVVEYNTSIARFRNQILSQVLTGMRQSCLVSSSSTGPAVLSETSHPISVFHTTNLAVQAKSINSVNVSIRNVLFQIIGFSSIIVRVSGEAVINIDYLGVDNQGHTQQENAPFTTDVIIPGNYPRNSFVTGDIEIDLLNINNILSSGTTLFGSVEIFLSMTAVVRVLSSSVSPASGQSVLVSETSHSLFVPVSLNLLLFAANILSNHVSLRNVLFELIGISSAVVRISGEAVLNISYLGIDGQNHSQQIVAPFSSVLTIPGNFASNISVEGSLIIDNIVTVPEEDPSVIAIIAVTANLFMTAQVRILAPA